MLQEFEYENQEHSNDVAEVYGSLKRSRDASTGENNRLLGFIKSFEGIYLYAGRDEYKQLYYTVRQALKCEGLLSGDIPEDHRMIKTLTDTLLREPEMLESALMVIQRFGK